MCFSATGRCPASDATIAAGTSYLSSTTEFLSKASGPAGEYVGSIAKGAYHAPGAYLTGATVGLTVGRQTSRIVGGIAQYGAGETAGKYIGHAAGLYTGIKAANLATTYALQAGNGIWSLGSSALTTLKPIGSVATTIGSYATWATLGYTAAAVGVIGLTYLGYKGISKCMANRRAGQHVPLIDLEAEQRRATRTHVSASLADPYGAEEMAPEYLSHRPEDWSREIIEAQTAGRDQEVADYLQVIAQQNEIIKETGGYTASNGEVVLVASFRDAIASSFIVRGRVNPRAFAEAGFRRSEARFLPAEEFEVVEGDCTDNLRALQRRGLNPALLNNANDLKPTGGYREGAGAQEEDICRRTLGLAGSLERIGEEDRTRLLFYGAERDRSGCIYTNQALVIREGRSRGYALLPYDRVSKVDVITSAAPDMRPESQESTEFRPGDVRYEAYTKGKIHNQIRTAIETGHDSLVVAAWGCGVFGNDPAIIARYYREVVERDFPGQIKIVFSILGRDNLEAFQAGFAPRRETHRVSEERRVEDSRAHSRTVAREEEQSRESSVRSRLRRGSNPAPSGDLSRERTASRRGEGRPPTMGRRRAIQVDVDPL